MQDHAPANTMVLVVAAGFVLLITILTFVAPAEAAFPGKNGKIAFVRDFDIWTVNPNGTDRTRITTHPADDVSPNWSPDGTKIAFQSLRDAPDPTTPCSPCRYEIYVMDADGSNVHRLTTTSPPGASYGPSWSPDGTRIAFGRARHVWTMAADGTDLQPVTEDDACSAAISWSPGPWSPDGTEVAVHASGYTCFDDEVYEPCLVRVADNFFTHCHWGAGPAQDWSPDSSRLVFAGMYTRGRYDYIGDPSYNELGVEGDGDAWSPDGTRIAFTHISGPPTAWRLDIIDAADGSNLTPLSAGDASESQADWQSIPINSYPRPAGAKAVKASLVPAYRACDPDQATLAHGAPLAHPSCASPALTSGHLTVGTGNANGQPANSAGTVWITQSGETPVNTANGDQADVTYELQLSDVRNASDLSDYTGELQVQAPLRITDRDNTPSPFPTGAATVSDTALSFKAPCTPTPASTIGATCAIATTADALVPGIVREAQRAVWELGKIMVLDGGADGDADTGPNTVFAAQGLFVP